MSRIRIAAAIIAAAASLGLAAGTTAAPAMAAVTAAAPATHYIT